MLKIALKRSDDDWRVVFSSKFHFIGGGQKTLINRLYYNKVILIKSLNKKLRLYSTITSSNHSTPKENSLANYR